jgi:hypothetical protein
MFLQSARLASTLAIDFVCRERYTRDPIAAINELKTLGTKWAGDLHDAFLEPNRTAEAVIRSPQNGVKGANPRLAG